jgi:hypothetical protein
LAWSNRRLRPRAAGRLLGQPRPGLPGGVSQRLRAGPPRRRRGLSPFEVFLITFHFSSLQGKKYFSSFITLPLSLRFFFIRSSIFLVGRSRFFFFPLSTLLLYHRAKFCVLFAVGYSFSTFKLENCNRLHYNVYRRLQ